MSVLDAKKRKLDHKYNPDNFFLKTYKYYVWFRNEELSDKEESDMPQLESYAEVKERKRLKILTPNKLLTRPPILSAQKKAGNSSNKLKTEIRQILYLLYQHNKINKKVYNNLIKS